MFMEELKAFTALGIPQLRKIPPSSNRSTPSLSLCLLFQVYSWGVCPESALLLVYPPPFNLGGLASHRRTVVDALLLTTPRPERKSSADDSRPTHIAPARRQARRDRTPGSLGGGSVICPGVRRGFFGTAARPRH
ncbi:hypothetical protein TNCV_1008511 [Trichonephila clavipes]|nr:hypothetical protein TNCV_1008511 [Trichonephila clavipes]